MLYFLLTDCYDSNDGEVDYIVVNFYDKTSMLDACISRSARNDTCRVCNENYTQLNLYYLRLDADYGSSLCNDIVDQVSHCLLIAYDKLQ